MYELCAYEWAGIALFEANGTPFTHCELWDLIGKSDAVATFNFVEGSAAFEQFGPHVVGTISYTVEERNGMSPESDLKAVKVVPSRRTLSVEQGKLLKYRGVSIEEICTISFIPTNRTVERYASGEKKVPNVITVPYKRDLAVNIDRVRRSYLITKNNDGIELTPCEKNVLVGLLLAENDGRIDSRILNHLGHDAKSAEDSVDVRYHRLTATQRLRTLTEEEENALDDADQIRCLRNATAVLKEVAKSQLTADEIPLAKDAIGQILESLKRFESSILLHSKPQVHWDIESYAHIVLRHVRDFQVGRFRKKTPFPYQVQDLKMLIEKVLGTLRDEIEHHFSASQPAPFTRHGAMSAFFNGDYYSLRVEPSGRLVAFYVRTDQNEAPPEVA